MSHGYTTTSWVQENLPELEALGREVVVRVIEQAIQDTKAKRFWVVLATILVPAFVVNVFHAEIIDFLGGGLSRTVLLAISVFLSAMAASTVSRNILHDRIRQLATGGL